MSERIDVPRLHAALDAERQARGLSWRQLATEAKVSPSLLSRMGKKHKPDLESFAALVQWLGVPAEKFMHEPVSTSTDEPSPAFETKLVPLLRAERDLTDEDKQYLMQMVSATMTFLREKRRDA